MPDYKPMRYVKHGNKSVKVTVTGESAHNYVVLFDDDDGPADPVRAEQLYTKSSFLSLYDPLPEVPEIKVGQWWRSPSGAMWQITRRFDDRWAEVSRSTDNYGTRTNIAAVRAFWTLVPDSPPLRVGQRWQRFNEFETVFEIVLLSSQWVGLAKCGTPGYGTMITVKGFRENWSQVPEDPVSSQFRE